MFGRQWIFGLFAAFALTSASGAIAQEAKPLWKQVAEAPLIVIATPRSNAQTPAEDDTLWLPLDEVEVLKGQPPSPLRAKRFKKDYPYFPSAADVERLSGRRTIAFLAYVDIGYGPQVYVGSAPDALQPADDAEAAVVAELAAQAALLAAWKPDPTAPRFDEVRRIIEEIVAIKPKGLRDKAAMDHQAELFRRLEALGPGAVPAIITLMDDRRPLPFEELSLVNHSPDAFEGMRHYGPAVMTDALAAILNQITAQSFGFIYNGASEPERANEVDAWRVYLARGLK